MSIGTPRTKQHQRKNKAPAVLEPRPVAALQPAPYFAWQNVRCRLAAAVLLVFGLPIMALLVLVIKTLSRGPAMYSQIRVGLNGRSFVMFKFRSMRIDAEAATGAVWTAENDPRITRLGRILRRLHLDEFPQLFNVVRGEMALIGPRPERPEFVHKLARQLPGYMGRLAVRPGITGLAQINLPPDTDLESVRKKLVLDLEYVAHGSLGMDLRILAATFLRLFHIRTAFLLWLLRLRRKPDSSPLTTHHSPDSNPSPLTPHPSSLADTIIDAAPTVEQINPDWTVEIGPANGHTANGRAKRAKKNGQADHGSSTDLLPRRPR